ncbi:MAG: aspartyl/asparaginyl beta-hydroxylase domain-containing protein [Microcystis aeruginosa BS13-02]|jgi:hypothetical protein|uniref:Aspartyl beta-hydroxylase n=1 Tax=Microcystis aeruginosa Ma_MB_S_20031200_S102 TaxID=2486254 RepID=A0A552F449_MICAE|nr:aspartyl/asparaginyl beta-hydroxylase domain-containing protein [Microcystis aeruginosa BS13-02]TRU29680.1 MAG: aspartyl beta-hydroxylase [Microcystis aeruginosa Ma_MB_S_20031200_S102D]TRU41466.1 MAG: aspartyl beta-hydroxylase [Microcystis aeruginosa Ma_MB_S_20031200_S102]
MSLLLPKDQTDLASPKKTKTIRELGPVDISSIREYILDLPREIWEFHDNDKPNKFEKLGRTEHIVFKFIRDYDNHLDNFFYPIWDEWKNRLEPILETATKPYGYKEGDFSRIMLAKLPAGAKISLHIDPFKSSNYTHKIHIPIITNPGVEFWLERKRIHFLEGYAYEVNNKALHGGINRGETDRINLIIEYYEK